jgi:hypothetical protein
MFSWSKSEQPKEVANLENLNAFYKKATSNTKFVISDLIFEAKLGDIYVYEVDPLPEEYTHLGYAGNLKVVCVENKKIALKEVDSRCCVLAGNTSGPNLDILLDFIRDCDPIGVFYTGNFVRPRKGVEITYHTGYKFSSPTKDKLYHPFIITNVKNDIITIAGTLEDGRIVETEVNKILLRAD